jgi:hypothetical protein
MNEIKELSKEQKLEAIESILNEWKKRNCENYICVSICNQALYKNYILADLYVHNPVSELSLGLIPEMIQIKPPHITNLDINWFGSTTVDFGSIRTKKLLELKEIIEKSQ